MAMHTDPSVPPVEQSDYVLVGLDGRGNWIARDAFGTRGGIFVSRAAALRFARLEFGHLALPIVMSEGSIELVKEREDPSTRDADGCGLDIVR